MNGASKQGSVFLEMLLILFIGLKLTKYIDWSWWWVLSPVWIPLLLVLVGFVLVALYYIIQYFIKKSRLKKKKMLLEESYKNKHNL